MPAEIRGMYTMSFDGNKYQRRMYYMAVIETVCSVIVACSVVGGIVGRFFGH